MFPSRVPLSAFDYYFSNIVYLLSFLVRGGMYHASLFDEKRGAEGLSAIVNAQCSHPHLLLSKAITHYATLRTLYLPSSVNIH